MPSPSRERTSSRDAGSTTSKTRACARETRFSTRSEPKPEAGRKTFGFNVGGPIVRNKAFFFFNVERNLIENAVVHTMPPEAAPLAASVRRCDVHQGVEHVRASRLHRRARTTSPSAGSARCRRPWAKTSSAARRSTIARSSSTPTIGCSTSAGRRCIGNRADQRTEVLARRRRPR